MDKTPISLILRLRHRDDKEAWARFVRLFVPLVREWAGVMTKGWTNSTGSALCGQ